jgi:hypothetical protein
VVAGVELKGGGDVIVIVNLVFAGGCRECGWAVGVEREKERKEKKRKKKRKERRRGKKDKQLQYNLLREGPLLPILHKTNHLTCKD